MFPYRISPYVQVVENRLIPNVVQYGAAHMLTGEVIELSERMRSLLSSLGFQKALWLTAEDLHSPAGSRLREWVEREFLIPFDFDPLSSFLMRYAVRPIQNPALSYRSKAERVLVVRTSMAEHVFSPGVNNLPAVIEEELPTLAASIFLKSDGTKTLSEIYASLECERAENLLEDKSFREALDFLTERSRQLIKFAPSRENLTGPYRPFNIVPRDLYHAERWGEQRSAEQTIKDFHVEGIEDAAWEFDVIEPTVNHALRFPSEVLGGLDYGSRFCLSTMRPEIFPLLSESKLIRVLEVGGGTGTFALSFLDQLERLRTTHLNGAQVDYRIMELSPALMRNQKRVLAEAGHRVEHFEQDATEFDLPGQEFDLLISNEVIADFEVAAVERSSDEDEKSFSGPGAFYVEKYDLDVEGAPASFLVNSGVFKFLERAWRHVAPGGTVILTEYGGERAYPTLSFHLSHEEYSIHFGHVAACARKIGFECRLLKLKDFLEANMEVPVLDGKEEQILCLNHVLQKFGARVPYALISEKEFYERFQKIVERINLVGLTFSPLTTGFHFGPSLNDFMALVMNKPR